jgi:hypothetical protein
MVRCLNINEITLQDFTVSSIVRVTEKKLRPVSATSLVVTSCRNRDTCKNDLLPWQQVVTNRLCEVLPLSRRCYKPLSIETLLLLDIQTGRLCNASCKPLCYSDDITDLNIPFSNSCCNPLLLLRKYCGWILTSRFCNTSCDPFFL